MKQALWDRCQQLRYLHPCRVPVNHPLVLTNTPNVSERGGWDARLWWETYEDGISKLSYYSCENFKAADRLCCAWWLYGMFSVIDYNGIKLKNPANELEEENRGEGRLSRSRKCPVSAPWKPPALSN